MTHLETQKRYCQSCGMPLLTEADIRHVENPDNHSKDEYCTFCYEAGEHTIYRPMSEMVEIWVANTDWYNQHTGSQYTPEEIRELMLHRLPTLNRWKQKLYTESLHIAAINKAIHYLQQHLFEKVETSQLASMNHLSKDHFRKIFKNVTGESLAAYIQRIRLEQIAHLLGTTNLTLEEIVSQSNYQSKSSLVKAFKKQFQMTTTEYREKYLQTAVEKPVSDLSYEIKWLPAQDILYVEIGDSYLNRDKYQSKWEQLQHQAGQLGFKSEKCRYVSISMDDPLITPTEQCRFYIGVLLPVEKKSQVQNTMQLAEGKYAIFHHIGNFSTLQKVYQTIYEQWLPENNYYPANTLSFEIYDHEQKSSEAGNWTTYIHIPIKKQKQN